MHSWNALSAGDVYGQWYGTGYFYEWANATSEFDNRLRHILNHNHKTLNKPWKELSEYIFAFEAENEAMIGKVSSEYLALVSSDGRFKGQGYIEDNQSWFEHCLIVRILLTRTFFRQCDRANTIKSELGDNSGVISISSENTSISF